MPHISSHAITMRTRRGSAHACLARAQCLRQPVVRLRSRLTALETIFEYQSTSSCSETRPSPDTSSSRWSLRTPRVERWKPNDSISPPSSSRLTKPDPSVSTAQNCTASRWTVASLRPCATDSRLIRSRSCSSVACRAADDFASGFSSKRAPLIGVSVSPHLEPSRARLPVADPESAEVRGDSCCDADDSLEAKPRLARLRISDETWVRR
mmetsp:Transcript_34767/g.80333  ORF Transcript_34767/g.80333 Transcript_34767/m.80333 type:complete len:210 (-) Transcript_34767:173-802(-)